MLEKILDFKISIKIHLTTAIIIISGFWFGGLYIFNYGKKDGFEYERTAKVRRLSIYNN